MFPFSHLYPEILKERNNVGGYILRWNNIVKINITLFWD
jgi:hypothetical protein